MRWRRLAELPARRPKLALLAAAVVTGVMVAGLARLEVDTSLAAMAVRDDPLHRAHDRYQAVFGSDEILSIALPLDDPLAPEALALQRRIAEAIAALPHVEEVESLATVEDVAGEDDLLRVEPLVPEGDPRLLSEEEIARIRARAARNPLLPGWLLAHDGRAAALHVRFDFLSSERDRNAALAEIDALLARELGERPYHLAGHLFMKSEIARTITHDLQLLLPVSIAVMTACLFLAVRCWRTTLLSLAGVLLALLWMLGAMGWAGVSLTALSNAAPTILMAIGTAYVLHLAAATQRHAAAGRPPAEAAGRGLRQVRFAMVGAGLTTLLGYGTLIVSQVPVVAGFGLALVLGMLGVMAVGLFVLPAAFALVAPRGTRSLLAHDPRLGHLLLALARVSDRRPRAVLGAAIALAVLALSFAVNVEVDSSGPNRFPADSRFRRSSEFYRAHLSGDVVESVYLSGPPDHFLQPDVLRRIQAFQREAEALPEIDESVSIADYVALMHRELNGGDPAELRIPDSAEAVGQLLFLYTASSAPGALDEILAPDADGVRVVLKADVPSSVASAELRARLQELAERILPEETRPDSVVSTEILLSRAADVVVREQVRGFASALLLIVTTVAIGFRSLAAGLHLLLPNGIPLLMILAVMTLARLPLSDATSIIAATCLGIAVDSSIHLMAETRTIERRHGSRRAAILQALLSTGRPVVVTGVLIVVGFLVLVLSDFRPVAELGTFMALAMAFCLFGDVLVLPSQLRLARGTEPAGARPVAVRSGERIGAALLHEDAHGRPHLELLDEQLARAGTPGTPPFELHPLDGSPSRAEPPALAPAAVADVEERA
ncbi:MAG TPA: MMPL family transporter [Myxococcota bacterium]